MLHDNSQYTIGFKVARNKVDCKSMMFSEFRVESFAEDVECYPGHRSCSENGVTRMSTEKSAVLTINGRVFFFCIFKSCYLKKTSKYPLFEEVEKRLWPRRVSCKTAANIFGPFSRYWFSSELP